MFTPPAKCTSIVALASSWDDTPQDRGGFHFYLSDMTNTAPGIDVFVVHPMDVGLELCFAILVAAMSHNRDVRVDYVNNARVGEVRAVHLN